MLRRTHFRVLLLGLILAVPLYCWGRGFGGSHGGGGGVSGGGMSRGGFSGGGMGGGGFSGGGMSRPSYGGGNIGGGFNGGGIERGQGGGGFNGGGIQRGQGGGGFNGGGIERGQGGGGFNGGGERNFAAPNRSQLNSFLGLPSDEGMHSLNSRGAGSTGSEFNVQHGSVEGPRGGEAAGATVTGPRGNEATRGVAEGPNGGVAAGGAVKGAGGGEAARGVAVGPNGRVAAGGAARGPNGNAAARGVVAGPNGYAAGFARVTPSDRYISGAAVRTNFNHYNMYGHGWYDHHSGYWYARGWAAGYAWAMADWAAMGTWFNYASVAPIYYNYGQNVVYENDQVYVNDQSVGTAAQYYDQALSLAGTNTPPAAATSDAIATPPAATDTASGAAAGDWMPLGVFALTKAGETKSDVVIQLAVDKAGIIRGNYTDTATDKTQLIHGSVDKTTQRVCFLVGDNKTNVVETGLYNLTKDEAPVLIHFGKDKTEQWLLVRLKDKDKDGDTAGK